MRSGIESFALGGLVALLALSMPAAAHHGGAVEWRQGESKAITGVATEFAFIFPHVQLELDVVDETGNTVHWTLVTRWTPTILRQHGWKRDSIKPGDRIDATYLPHVQSPAVGSIQSIEVNGTSLPISF